MKNWWLNTFHHRWSSIQTFSSSFRRYVEVQSSIYLHRKYVRSNLMYSHAVRTFHKIRSQIVSVLAPLLRISHLQWPWAACLFDSVRHLKQSFPTVLLTSSSDSNTHLFICSSVIRSIFPNHFKTLRTTQQFCASLLIPHYPLGQLAILRIPYFKLLLCKSALAQSHFHGTLSCTVSSTSSRGTRYLFIYLFTWWV